MRYTCFVFSLTVTQREKLTIIGAKYHLRFVILHGSFALGKEQEGSDIDIAILGYRKPAPEEFFNIQDDLADLLCQYQKHELDLKTIHQVDPFFRYLVLRDGVLLYGDLSEYQQLKVYAFRDFTDTSDLRRLDLHLIRKKQKILDERYSSSV